MIHECIFVCRFRGRKARKVSQQVAQQLFVYLKKEYFEMKNGRFFAELIALRILEIFEMKNGRLFADLRSFTARNSDDNIKSIQV